VKQLYFIFHIHYLWCRNLIQSRRGKWGW